MKNFFSILSSIFLLIVMASCNSQKSAPSAKVNSLLESGEFTFMAERANPTNFDVQNVMNSLPNSSASRILNLDYGYTLQIKKDEIKVELPYFGRVFTPSPDPANSSFRFDSKDFAIDKMAGKKGSFIYTILPKDQRNIRKMVLEVFGNGKSYLSVDANDRNPISYDGRIMENLVEKK